jgi:hypothetical protein
MAAALGRWPAGPLARVDLPLNARPFAGHVERAGARLQHAVARASQARSFAIVQMAIWRTFVFIGLAYLTIVVLTHVAEAFKIFPVTG